MDKIIKLILIRLNFENTKGRKEYMILNDQQTTVNTVFYEFPVHHNAALTSAEVAQLWNTYMHYSMLSCIFTYFEAQAKDPEIRTFMKEALERCQSRANISSDLLNGDNQPIPVGFSAEDVNVNAPPLYADNYLLHYLRHMLRFSFTMNSFNLNLLSRPDVRDFYIKVLESSLRLKIKVDDLALAKGILPRPPITAMSKEVEFVHNPSFLAGFLGEKRPLLAMEIAHLYYNALSNQVARILLLGFKQVSQTQDVRDYFAKGIKITDKFFEKLSSYANKEDIFFNFLSDGDLTDSTEPPFSDKLMMFHINSLSLAGIGMYGVSMGASQRHDVAAAYATMMLETGQYAEKGAKLAMEKEWLEEPPQVVDRDKLSGMKH